MLSGGAQSLWGRTRSATHVPLAVQRARQSGAPNSAARPPSFISKPRGHLSPRDGRFLRHTLFYHASQISWVCWAPHPPPQHTQVRSLQQPSSSRSGGASLQRACSLPVCAMSGGSQYFTPCRRLLGSSVISDLQCCYCNYFDIF